MMSADEAIKTLMDAIGDDEPIAAAWELPDSFVFVIGDGDEMQFDLPMYRLGKSDVLPIAITETDDAVLAIANGKANQII